MKTIEVQVKFDGVVEVSVPDHLKDADAKLLAKNLALAKICATTVNEDAPEEDACLDYEDSCSAKAAKTADEDWDKCEINDFAAGGWEIGKVKVLGVCEHKTVILR